MGRIESLFNNRNPQQKIVSLFITAGYPEPVNTVSLVLELERAGADMIELGMPFSDPLADGPTIQHASDTAIRKGVHLETIFGMVREIRRHSNIPIVLMGYVNPVMRFGIENFFKMAASCGADGIILPDVPPGEFPQIEHWARNCHINLIYLVAPNTPDERMRQIDRCSSGFVYCVSVTGVTGVRKGSEISRSVEGFIQRVKKNVIRNPVLIGFGIRSHSDACTISSDVEGYIVGSALIDYIDEIYPQDNWISKAADFVRELKTGSRQIPDTSVPK